MSATDFLRPPWAWPRGVSSMLVEGPLHEPLTLPQAKLRAGLDWPDGDPRDDLMLGFIAAARQQVELDTGLALIKQTRLVTFDVPPDTVLPLPSQALPCLELTDETAMPVSLEVRGAPRLLPRLEVRAAGVSPRMILDVRAGTLTLPYGASGTYRVVAGWPDRATLATEAPLLYHAVGLLTAHYATLGRDLASAEGATSVPMGYEEAIAPFRLIWLA